MNHKRKNHLVLGVVILSLLAVPSISATGDGVERRSGTIGADRPLGGTTGELQRLVVQFNRPVGWFEKARLETSGTAIEAPLSGQAYLVSVPAGRGISLSAIPGVDWVAPFLPQDKIAPEIADVTAGTEGGDIVVLLHLFKDADPLAVAARLSQTGLQVDGVGSGSRFDRIVLQMSPEQVASRRDDIAAMEEVFWLSRRHRRILSNNNSIWVGQSGLYAGQTTPVFDQGIYGEGQIAAVLDTGLDADMCFFEDGVLGLPPTNDGSTTTVDLNQRKVIAVDFLDPAEDPLNMAQWDTQGHGTHVAGILAGDDLANPLIHDSFDGMAPGAKLVIQDAGFAADSCGDLPGIGCPVTDLIPVFQQAYDQGARTHSNSWNDNENAAVQNNYTDASEDVDEFMWNNPDFLIVFACGNHALGGDETMGSPSTAKNTLSVGGVYGGENGEYLSDISAWGPTDDGRIKPDVVFPSASIDSAGNDFDASTGNCADRRMTGTSMAAPGVAGNSLLVREYFERGFYPTGAEVPADGFTATSALVKAMMINSGEEIGWDAEGRPITIPSGQQGWGRVILDSVLHFSGDGRGLFVDDHTNGFVSPADAPVRFQLEVLNSDAPLEVTLVWNDYPSTPAATTHLINDLDLRVDGASGSYHGNYYYQGQSTDHGVADRLNNVEAVLVKDPVPGVYTVEVSAHAVPQAPQPWALVVSGNVAVTTGPRPAYLSHVVNDNGPNGNGDGVLDPGETATLELTMRNPGDADATGISAEMYSIYPELFAVYGGSVGFPDIPVSGQGSSLNPHFDVTMQPDAACGMVLGAGMDITGNGFAVESAFTIDAGLYEGDRPSEDTPMSIPKTVAALYSQATVTDTFPLTDVSVTVNIDHDDISELRVSLQPPGGVAPVFLHDYSQPGVSGIHTTYPDLTAPDGPGSFDSLVGIDPQGVWQLKIVDQTGGGTRAGTLVNWTLHLKGSIPWDCNPVGCADPVPNPVGDNLTVDKSGANDVVVSWSAATGASEYNVRRARDGAFTTGAFVGSTVSTSLVDAGAQTLPGANYYLVRSVNSCRWESP